MHCVVGLAEILSHFLTDLYLISMERGNLAGSSSMTIFSCCSLFLLQSLVSREH